LTAELFDEAINSMTMTTPPEVFTGGHSSAAASPFSTSLGDSFFDLPIIPAHDHPPHNLDELHQTILKDLYLFDHYVDHTCHDLEILPEVAFVKRFGIPQLATENSGILCSVMALGAACLSIDILSGHDCGQVPDLSLLISTGDRYHRLGMQALQQQMSSTQPRDLAEAHAHAILLFPYALARRRISHLLNDIGPPTPSSGVDMIEEHLSSVGWMIILRGVTTTGRACFSNNRYQSNNSPKILGRDSTRGVPSMISSHLLLKLSEPSDRPSQWNTFQCQVATKHPLFPVVSATRSVALETLRQKVETMEMLVRDHHRKGSTPNIDLINIQLARSTSVSACLIAVDLLLNLESTLFDPDFKGKSRFSDIPASAADSPIPWLKGYAKLPVYDPELPALRTVFAWINTTPEEYFQLLMKPLPADKDGMSGISEDVAVQDIDRKIQLLAWDVWAHWLVFAILIEDESFFTASLGVPDITHLAPYFSQMAVSSPGSNLSSSPPAQDTDWWPWSMCAVAKQLRRYQGVPMTA
jgi:hypothetical protein